MSKECSIFIVNRYDGDPDNSSIQKEIELDADAIVQGHPLPDWPLEDAAPTVDWYDGDTIEVSYLGEKFSMRCDDFYAVTLSSTPAGNLRTRDVMLHLSAPSYVRNDDFNGMFLRGSFDSVVYNFLVRRDDGTDMDLTAKRIFYRLFYARSNIRLLRDETVEMLKKEADAGSVHGLYAYGRCLVARRPDYDWVETAGKCFRKAAEAGCPDAYAELSDLYYYGDFGYVDYGKAKDYLRKGIDEGSMSAVMKTVRKMISGCRIIEEDLEGALRMVNAAILQEPDIPEFRQLRGLAGYHMKPGAEAVADFKYAAENGVLESWMYYAVAAGCDADGHIADVKVFSDILETGVSRRAVSCLNVRNRYFRPEDPSSPDFEEERENYMDCLEKIYGMGCTEGAVTLGDLYRDGDLGLKQDYDMAFTWYSRAAIFGDATGYERMYGMLCDGRKEEDRNFMDQCVINSVHCDSDVLIEEAVKIYRAGRLTMFAREMEQYFIPMLEAQEKAAAEAEEEDEDDYPDDDGRYDAYV